LTLAYGGALVLKRGSVEQGGSIAPEAPDKLSMMYSVHDCSTRARSARGPGLGAALARRENFWPYGTPGHYLRGVPGVPDML